MFYLIFWFLFVMLFGGLVRNEVTEKDIEKDIKSDEEYSPSTLRKKHLKVSPFKVESTSRTSEGRCWYLYTGDLERGSSLNG